MRWRRPELSRVELFRCIAQRISGSVTPAAFLCVVVCNASSGPIPEEPRVLVIPQKAQESTRIEPTAGFDQSLALPRPSNSRPTLQTSARLGRRRLRVVIDAPMRSEIRCNRSQRTGDRRGGSEHVAALDLDSPSLSRSSAG